MRLTPTIAAATLCYNFFFPPLDPFTIAEPANWETVDRAPSLSDHGSGVTGQLLALS